MTRAAAVALALLLTMVTDGRARADSSADEADARFRRGTELYKRRRYDEALLEFFTSNRLVPNRNVVFNIARSLEALERFDEAYRYYSDFIAGAPAPEDRQAAEARLAELAPRVALLEVRSTPPGATVFVDRRDLGGRGETPLVLALPPGAHQLILEREGFEPAQRAVSLDRGRKVEVELPLDAVVGSLRIVTRPPGEVRVDRPEDDSAPPDAAATPATLRLAPGRHAIEIRAPGHRPLRRLITIEPRQEHSVEAALEPLPRPTGSLALGGRELGARVSIDGVAYGVLPLVATIPIGAHLVQIDGDGYEPWSRTVDVGKNAHIFVDVELREREPEVRGATRVAQRLGEAPASVSLLPAEELRAFGYETLADAARGLRGLYESDDRNYRAVGLRGFSRPGDYTNRVLVLRDGHVWNDAIIGSGSVGRDFAPDLEDLARLEVIRGPGSAFYGQGAFFGVLNAVSLAPGEGPKLAAAAALLSDGGSRAHVRGSLTSERAGAASVAVSAYGGTGSTHFYEEFAGTPSAGFVRDADGETALRASLRWKLGDLSLDAALNRRDKEIPTATFGTVFDPAHASGTGGTVESTLDNRGYLEARYERSTLLLRLYGDYAAYTGTYPYSDAETGPFILEDLGSGFGLGGEARVSFTAPAWNRLTLGAEAARQDLEIENVISGPAMDFRHQRVAVSLAGYAVDELQLGPVRVTAGARADRLSTTEELVISPRLAVVARPYEHGRSKLVIGQAYRAPSEYEQYYNDSGVTQIAAPPLDAEIIGTVEVEHTHELGRGSFLLLSLFASRIEKLIGLDTDEASGKLVYGNAADTLRVLGVEAEGRLRLAPGSWISATVSFTDLDGGDDLARANSLPLAASVKALWTIARATTIAVEVVYNSPRRDREGGETEPMLLARLVAGGPLTPKLRWKAGIFNALDWSYEVPVGDEFVQLAILQDLRRLYAGLSYEF